MHKSLIINNLEFAQNALELDETIEAIQLPRLAESLMPNSAATIQIKLQGAGKLLRHFSLQLHVIAVLPVICQRCLNELLMPINLKFYYLLIESAESAHDDDETDWLLIEPEMNVLDLIEDELLMAMPIAPAHDHDCSKLSLQSGEKPNPFSVLKNLKTQNPKKS